MQALSQCQLCRLWYVFMVMMSGEDQALCDFVKSVQGHNSMFLGLVACLQKVVQGALGA